MLSDEALILEFRRGSREAFQELFERYRQPLYCFFRRRIMGCERAEDLTQETFLAVIGGITRYEPRALVRTYLYGIAVKLVAVERRKQKRMESTQDAIQKNCEAAEAESALWVRLALGKLDEREREILMLREYEQLSYEEIAEILRVPVNTVRSRLFRSRMQLRKHLESSKQSEGAHK